MLGDAQSYALAVTRDSVHRYSLPPRDLLEKDAEQYRSTLKKEKTDLVLGQRLFDELLAGIPEFKNKDELIVVPDGKLHLLPFDALVNAGTVHPVLTPGDSSSLGNRIDDAQKSIKTGYSR